jgi:hypothetical protein
VRSRTAVLAVIATAVLLAAGPPPASPAEAQSLLPGPPPLAFRTATLAPVDRQIHVALMAVVDDVGVTVLVSRHGRRLGRGRGVLRRGGVTVEVPVGPRARALRRGFHVNVSIFYGGPAPLLAHPALR